MHKGILTHIDKIDDLIYEFYKELDSSCLKEKPEYRFLLLSPLLENLCKFSLGNSQNSFNELLKKMKLPNNEALKKSKTICDAIISLTGHPTYFAASYWSPIDEKRHTISHAIEKNTKEEEYVSKASALLFYIVTIKAPPVFHSAINYIATISPRKDGLHSYYKEAEHCASLEEVSHSHIWWHIPESIHNTLLTCSGFNAAVKKLISKDPAAIAQSLQIIMENLYPEKVNAEIKKYEDIYLPLLDSVSTFEVPDVLNTWIDKYEAFLNNFFYPPDISTVNTKRLSRVQVFFMACTNALYNKACPTQMFYTFPVRVSNTCCILTLGVEKELELENILAMSHVVKSIYYHALNRDYNALNALERNRIAHGAVHKIRGPLNILKEFPHDVEDMLTTHLAQPEFNKIKPILSKIKQDLAGSIENILLGVISLENFIEIENPGTFDLTKTLRRAQSTYDALKVRIIDKLEVNSMIHKKALIFGVQSHIQFIFEELISNSIRAFKHHFRGDTQRKLNITITLKESRNNTDWIVHFTDNGPGIPAEKKETIFSSGTRGSDSGGSGMGLFLSKLFLNKYNHDIMECGEAGKGVDFIITFKKAD